MGRNASVSLKHLLEALRARPLPATPEPLLTCRFIHWELIGQDPTNLAEGGHLDSILFQLALHVVDLLLWEREDRADGTDPRIAAERGKREKGVGLGGQRQTVPGSCVIIWFWRLAQGQRAELGWQETLWQLLMTFTFPGAPPLFTHSAASAALRLTAVSPWFTYYCMLLQWWRLIAMTWHLASRDEVRGSVQVFPA